MTTPSQPIRSNHQTMDDPGIVMVPTELIRNQEQMRRSCQNTCVIMFPNGAAAVYPRNPCPITCQFCESKVVTEVDSQCNCLSIAVCLCMPFGFLLLSGTSDNIHSCPVCKKVVGANTGC